MNGFISLRYNQIRHADCGSRPLAGSDMRVHLDYEREPREGNYVLVKKIFSSGSPYEIVQFADYGKESLFIIGRKGVYNIPYDHLREISAGKRVIVISSIERRFI